MGLIRKGLHLATLGAVAPNSRKQRTAAQTLAAIQGASPAEVARTGGRYAHSIGAELARSRAARPDPLQRTEAELMAAGATLRQARQYRAVTWKRKWLRQHPAIAARLFPGGTP